MDAAALEQGVDWWDELPLDVRKEIDRSLSELDEGNCIPHNEVANQLGCLLAL